MKGKFIGPELLREFKFKQFDEVILWDVRWYTQFPVTYRDLVTIAAERRLIVAHTTIMRWVHEYTPKIVKKIKGCLKRSNDSYRVDETYIKIKRKMKNPLSCC